MTSQNNEKEKEQALIKKFTEHREMKFGNIAMILSV